MEFELRTSRALPESVDQSTQSQTLFDTIPDALKAIRNGECVVVVDDERRENEGDLICAAQFATPEQINFMATEARGLICLAWRGIPGPSSASDGNGTGRLSPSPLTWNE